MRPTVARFGLDGQGPQAPNKQMKKVSRRLYASSREGIEARRAETFHSLAFAREHKFHGKRVSDRARLARARSGKAGRAQHSRDFRR